jgi:hypothetical protein
LYIHKNNPDTIEQHKRTIEKLKSLFNGAIFVEEIPNEYSSWDANWLMVTTKVGHFKVGYRSKVINIDWSKTTVKGSGKQLFPNEDVTKGGDCWDTGGKQYIHAWSLEKGREYIQKIIDLGTKITPDMFVFGP